MSQAPVFQIVGYKNSGKTTVLCELIEYGSSMGEQVASIKRHGHHQPLEPMHEHTDSYQLQKAGSFLTGIDSSGTFQLEFNHNQSFPLQRLIDLYQTFDPDLIIVEGYKQESYRKAVIIKDEADLALLQLDGVQFVLTWNKEWTSHLDIPVFTMEQWKQSIRSIYEMIKREGRE
ncbi:molybdopterin-guanine dinucleotide biosynthesis protein B [Halobacillus naozhouensis]|uniref:Molybdopterin-guanine dinucleotide biosynthesis protein B n=1 Tax=Halobacillus naozhouensis TaxID=554880 RepID=A0ABY8J1C7_9BACI|nr:molybdopterin-guanine dinucleotide biosynthesis protein B [Halobacillus naozhouensis]WFT76150.1 molybdopterin-guanine dinucleotide biosynthesis protein B [Halobacillus naozhouensis]